MLNKKLCGTLVASAFAGALASQAALADNHNKAKTDEKPFCETTCKGKSACHGHGNSECAGKNGCAGKGWMKAKDEAECKKAGGNWKDAKKKA